MHHLTAILLNGLRDYGVAGQIGLEATPDAYVATLVAVFRLVRRVLRDDGTVWLNLGDSYAAQGGGKVAGLYVDKRTDGATWEASRSPPSGYKPKDLLMIPARVALALQADGWWLRSDIIWSKPNPMPESVGDRPTSAHEHVFLLAKQPRYYFDADAVREQAEARQQQRLTPPTSHPKAKLFGGTNFVDGGVSTDRNIRNVWTIATAPYAEAHFATFPPELAERCIKAGSRAGDTILDPFAGAGTTLLVADRLQRDAIGIELNPTYASMATNRLRDDAGMFAEVAD